MLLKIGSKRSLSSSGSNPSGTPIISHTWRFSFIALYSSAFESWPSFDVSIILKRARHCADCSGSSGGPSTFGGPFLWSAAISSACAISLWNDARNS